MCSAWTIAVPARRRGGGAVAPLLDVRREGGPDEHGAHLFGDGPQLRAKNLELNIHSRVSRNVVPSLAPTHRGGSSKWHRRARGVVGPSTRVARLLAVSVAGLAAGPLFGSRRARSPVTCRPTRSAPRVPGGSARRDRAQRDGQLERLSAIAEVGLAVGRQLSGLVQRARTPSTVSLRSSLATRPNAESTPAASGTSTVSMPSSSASARMPMGPPLVGDGREASRVVASFDGDDAQRARSISAFTISITSAGSRSPNAASAAGGRARARRQLAGSRPREDSRRRPSARCRHARSRRGRTRPRSGPTRSAPPTISPDDRASSGAHRVDVDHGQPDRGPPNAALGRPLGIPVRDEAHVRRRPSHVEGDRVLDARLLSDERRADDSRGRP